MSEIDVISHLMDVEQQASTLIFDAHTEADKNIANARNKADGQYKAEYEKLIQSLEADYTSRSNAVENKYKTAFQEYKEEINKSSKDLNGFNGYLDKLLFEER